MEQFKTLYRYELKKITGKKLFKITLALFLLLAAVLVVIQLTGKFYVDGVVVDTHYHMFLVDREYERALSGRAIDQSLLDETIAAYRTIPDPEGRYTLTKEYQTNARPYSAIYQLISRWTDTPLLEDVLRLDVSESSFYEARSALLKKEWLFIAICLSGVFAEEHARRTDQLSLSAVNGKTTLYLAKILAGITVSVCSCTLIVLTAFLFSLGIFGTDGFGMPVQATLYAFSYPMSIGGSCLITGVMALFVSALMSVFVMFLSEVLHNSTAALSVCTGFIILASMVSVPPGYRVLSQIWDWLPFSFLERTHVFDVRTIPVFGHCLVSWQVVPVLYLLLSAGIASLGWLVYRRYQVSGR